MRRAIQTSAVATPSSSALVRATPIAPTRRTFGMVVPPKWQASDEAENPLHDDNANLDGTIVHSVPCARCIGKRVPCRGIQGRRCKACAQAKVGCEKFSGRHGPRPKERKLNDGVPKTKARAAQASTSRRQRSPSQVEVLDKVKTAPNQKGKGKAKANGSGRDRMELAEGFRLLEAKGRVLQGRLKSAESELDDWVRDLKKLSAKCEVQEEEEEEEE